MGQFAWLYYPKVRVKYAFINRTTKVKLGKIIDIDTLRKEIFHISTLRFTFDELQYLKSLKIFQDEYLDFLNKLVLPPVFITDNKGELQIGTSGLWPEAIFWETYILSIVNELYTKTFPHGTWLGEEKLEYKIQVAQLHPFKFCDFGTRRRYSYDWHEKVLIELKKLLPSTSFLGTSNVYFAKKLKLKPIGTFAHELPMIICGINDYGKKSYHKQVLKQWYDLYGEELSIALTDTYGTDFFFKEGIFNIEKWRGLRQDSGDPFKFVTEALNHYKKLGIDPKQKIIVFSDGLDIDRIMNLEKQFKDKVNTFYGWGTNLTNDCGVKPLSIVVKAIEADGKALVKLSDNLAKALGEKDVIEEYKKIFGYTNKFKEKTRY